MPSEKSQPKDIPALLAAAIKDAGTNVTAIGRAWSEFNGTKAESKRRLLQKYLKGESAPEEEGARELALILRKPSDYLVTERKRISRRDLDAVWLEIGYIRDALAQLSRALEDR